MTFHDGIPFDAEAAKFNLERAISEDAVLTDLSSLESVEVIDSMTVAGHGQNWSTGPGLPTNCEYYKGKGNTKKSF